VFGFAGRLATFSALRPGQVRVENVVTDEVLVARAAALQGSLMGQDMGEYCAQKAAHEQDPADQEMWVALQAQLAPPADRRARLVRLMGVEPPKAQNPAPVHVPGADAVDELNQRIDDLDVNANAPPQLPNGVAPGDHDHDHDEGQDPFAGVQEGDFSHTKPTKPLALAADPTTASGRITAALLVADYDAAVKECVGQGMWAEALVIAAMGPRELQLKTQDQFTAAHTSEVHRLIGIVARNDWPALVNDAVLANWRETLAMLCTYAPDDALPALCGMHAPLPPSSRSREAADGWVLPYRRATRRPAAGRSGRGTQEPRAGLLCVRRRAGQGRRPVERAAGRRHEPRHDDAADRAGLGPRGGYGQAAQRRRRRGRVCVWLGPQIQIQPHPYHADTPWRWTG
jgi:hypothetical protein